MRTAVLSAASIMLIFGIILSADRVFAELYSWTDSNGVKHFSTVGVPKEYAAQARSNNNASPGEYTNDYGMKFVTIQPGTFFMGSPSAEIGRDATQERLHKVTLTRAYQMQVTEVTQKQWQAVMGNNPSFHIGDRLPVHRVSWSMAHEFIRRLNEMDPDGNYRLPTEAEWEYACRAGTQTAFSSGGISNEACLPDPALDAVGWYCGNSGKTPKSVAQKMPNAWGLYDMHGNVSEFCQDFQNLYPAAPVTDPAGPISGSNIIARGGGFNQYASYCRSAFRLGYAPERNTPSTGLRLVRSMPNKAEEDKKQTSRAPQPQTPAEHPIVAKKEIYENAFGMKFMRVAPGTFKIGSDPSELGRDYDELKKPITLTIPFYMQLTETTRRHWLQIIGPEDNSSGLCTSEACPIDNVSWQQVQQFIGRLNENDPSGQYRLPTEAEWEYVCRAGSATAYANGGFQNLALIGWYEGNSSMMPHPVGLKQPNPWGFFDMHGNLAEWCLDYYRDIRYSGHEKDPVSNQPVDESFRRTIRGGSYRDDHAHCRSAARSGLQPQVQQATVGFRLVYIPSQ